MNRSFLFRLLSLNVYIDFSVPGQESKQVIPSSMGYIMAHRPAF
jgi:hypothetical protein